MESTTIPHKRSRRTKAAVAALRSKLLAIVEANKPLTVGQVFERAVAGELVAPHSYNSVSKLLADMRRDGVLPFEWIVYAPPLRPQAAV